MGTTLWSKFKVEQLPIPEPYPEQEQCLEALVTEILARKKARQGMQPLENEVDARVFALYGLSETDVQNIIDSALELSATDRAQIVAEWRALHK